MGKGAQNSVAQVCRPHLGGLGVRDLGSKALQGVGKVAESLGVLPEGHRGGRSCKGGGGVKGHTHEGYGIWWGGGG